MRIELRAEKVEQNREQNRNPSSERIKEQNVEQKQNRLQRAEPIATGQIQT
jgi:hypothetical protein